MIDLSIPECDVYIRAELVHAGIRPITQKAPMLGEVPARVTGRLTREGVEVFTFRRAWDHWEVKGFVPLAVAEEIYNHSSGLGRRDVLVIGDESCPHPAKWANSGGINYYHIDCLEALVLFVKIIKENGLA